MFLILKNIKFKFVCKLCIINKTNKHKSTEILPPLFLTPPYSIFALVQCPQSQKRSRRTIVLYWSIFLLANASEFQQDCIVLFIVGYSVAETPLFLGGSGSRSLKSRNRLWLRHRRIWVCSGSMHKRRLPTQKFVTLSS